MSNNYEANRHLAQQRLLARREEAARERLLNSGAPREPGFVQRFRAWLGSRPQTARKQKNALAPSGRKRAA